MKCAYCGRSRHWKWNPPTWMRWTPGPMKNIRCSECGHEYVRWFGLFSLRHGTARMLCTAWHWILSLLLFVASLAAFFFFMGW